MDKFFLYKEWIQAAVPHGEIKEEDKILLITTEKNEWKIDLKDRLRFNEYRIFQKNKKSAPDDWTHILSVKELPYGIFWCMIQDEFKKRGYVEVEDDYRKVKEAFNKYYGLILIRDYFKDRETKIDLDFDLGIEIDLDYDVGF